MRRALQNLDDAVQAAIVSKEHRRAVARVKSMARRAQWNAIRDIANTKDGGLASYAATIIIQQRGVQTPK